MDKIFLDGQWSFCIDDQSETGEPITYSHAINVPYAAESKLSGVGFTGDIRSCRYKKAIAGFAVPEGERLFLRFGACDYVATVFINGHAVCVHEGGYTPFEADITDFWLTKGENVIEVAVLDDMREYKASGKQTKKDKPYGCFYTRATGIWQSVYIECRKSERITDVKFFPDINAPAVEVALKSNAKGEVSIEFFYENRLCGKTEGVLDFDGRFICRLSEKHLWEIGNGRLYDVVITFAGAKTALRCGLREVKFDGVKFLLNGKSVFQRLVLDQGYYPGGDYTPASATDFEEDIRRAQALGFNGARLHQKVFDPAYLDAADRLGFLVWDEFPSWGVDFGNLEYFDCYRSQWKEVLDRDFNHPSVVIWCPFNEVWNNSTKLNVAPDLRFIENIYEFTKAYDPSRPCVDVSGGYHGRKTDLFDFHSYGSAEDISDILCRLENKGELVADLIYGAPPYRFKKGMPVMLSEFGGIAMIENSNVPTVNEDAVLAEEPWGYGKGETSPDKFAERVISLVDVILDSPSVSGFCYTQLYDIMQEQNGLFTYERKCKFSEKEVERIKRHISRRAAIE